MKRFGLSKNERMRSHKDIQKIYSFGKTISSSDKKLKATFFIQQEQPEGGVKLMAAVSKKSGNAVWRNRIKRLIKESFRMNKKELTEKCIKKKIRLYIVFSALSINNKENKKVHLNEISPPVIELMAAINRSF